MLAHETEGLTSSILKEEAGMLLSLEGCGLVAVSGCLARRFSRRAAAFHFFIFILNKYVLVFLDHFDVLMSKMIFKK